MGPGGGGGDWFRKREDAMQKLKEPKPKNIKEVPHYLKKVVGGFFYRLFYIFKLVWETRPWILFVMLFMALFNGVMPVLGAYIGAELLNSLASAYNAAVSGAESQFSNVMFLLILNFGYIFLNSFVHSINNILSRIYGELVVKHIKTKIMTKSKDIDLASFDLPEFYAKLENASNEAGNRPIHIMNSTFSLVSTIISMVSFIAILAAVSPWAPVIVILMAVPSAILNFVYRNKNFKYVRGRSKDRRQMNYYSGLLTNKDMVKEIRIFGLGNLFIERFNETFKNYFAGLRKIFIAEGFWNIGITIFTSTIRCGLFLYIAKGVCDGVMKLGDYSLYTGALNSIANGVTTFINTTATIYEGTLFIDNMIEFMAEEKTIRPITDKPLVPKHRQGHTIKFENVSFRYPGTERDVIKNLNLTLEPGESVVLVGLNGAGKTTLIKLLTRLYDPTEGRILLDGEDIRKYDVDELYKLFGIIFQDFGKYAVTVKENIIFGELNKEVEEENIVNAAVQSNSSDFINNLEFKYDTPLMRIFEDNGIELSIGQWQKLSVARAFYSDSDILILDEPTASLDAMAEQEIYDQFDKLRKDKTTIFVSHRLSSATVASKIVVLEYGEMIELGNHRELMAKKGRYYDLFTTQASRYLSTLEDGELDLSHMNTGDEDNSHNDDNNMHHHHHGDRPHHGERPPFPPNGRPPFGHGGGPHRIDHHSLPGEGKHHMNRGEQMRADEKSESNSADNLHE